MELIDRQATLEIAMSYCPDDDGCCSKAGCDLREMLDEIEALPTAKPEVHSGRWIFVGEETMHDGWTYRKYKCSECGFSTVEAKNFCQNCGAKMDENESMFTDTFSQCDGCPDWVGNKCKSHGHGCEGGGPDNG